MTKSFFHTLTALGLSVTLATGAIADQRSYAHTHGGQQHGNITGEQVAGGLLALLLLGIAIDQLDDGDRDRNARVRIETPDRRDRDHDARPGRRVLPSQCLRRFNTNNGPRRVVMERCLERNYRFTHRLPRECEIRVRTDRGVRDAFGARCLRRNGFNFNG